MIARARSISALGRFGISELGLLLQERIRTLRCPKCNGITATNRDACPTCGVSLSPGELAVAADREDVLLTMEHDADHALHTAELACYWNFIILVPIIHQLFDDLKTLSFNYELALYEINIFLTVNAVVMPLVLMYGLYLLIKWHRQFASEDRNDPRIWTSWNAWRRGLMHFLVAVGLYVGLDVLPFAIRGPNVFGL